MIVSPMAEGNGAIIIHRQLERSLPDYRVIPYSPCFEYAPIFLGNLRLGEAKLIHSAPDHAIFHARKDIPLVVTFHNYVLDRFMHKYSSLLQVLHYATDLRLFTHQALKRAIAVTTVSKFIAQIIKEDMGFKGKIYVIPNGIDTNSFALSRTPRKSSEIRVLFSGNLTRRKGAQWLLDIARRLSPGLKLICTGGLRGSKYTFSAHNVEYTGRINHEDIPALYQSVDMLLMPTVREGFGMAVGEAMSCGLPVVATNCSNIPELIHQGKGGYLCELGDTVGFAARINELAESPERRREMGEYNRARIESKFRVETMVNRYRELFEEVLG